MGIMERKREIKTSGQEEKEVIENCGGDPQNAVQEKEVGQVRKEDKECE